MDDVHDKDISFVISACKTNRHRPLQTNLSLYCSAGVALPIGSAFYVVLRERQDERIHLKYIYLISEMKALFKSPTNSLI